MLTLQQPLILTTINCCSKKLCLFTKGNGLTKMFEFYIAHLFSTWKQEILFFFQGKHNFWRNAREGLPQGSILAPLLFNIYTNDQPTFSYSRSFIYADDLALTVQGETFEANEHQLTSAVEDLSLYLYYKNNQLKPNPLKSALWVPLEEQRSREEAMS